MNNFLVLTRKIGITNKRPRMRLCACADGGARERRSRPRPHFFGYFYTINKRIMQSTHSLQLKQTPPAFFSHYLFDIFFIESRNEKTRGCLWGFFFREIFVIVYLLITTRERPSIAPKKTPNPRCLFVFPFSFLIDDRLEKRFNDFLFKS